MEADEPDPELGYIVVEAAEPAALRDVRRFAEKPTFEEARRLCEDGALWNTFIVVCRAASLIELYRARYPEALEILQGIDLRNRTQLADAYRMLPRLDFSRQIATGQEDRLTVMPVPRCGWNDLGTPQRLAQTLARHPRLLPGRSGRSSAIAATHVNLAERLMQAYPGCVSDHVASGSLPAE
jgi:mannose-1-phosphate guanylyltransferase